MMTRTKHTLTARLRETTYDRIKSVANYMGIPVSSLLHLMLRWAARTPDSEDYLKWWALRPPTMEDLAVVHADLKPEFQAIMLRFQEQHGLSRSAVIEAIWVPWVLNHREYLPWEDESSGQ